MEKRKPAGNLPSSSNSRVLPQIARIRAYQRVASEQGVPFAIAESQAAAMMRQPCIACGTPAPTEGHGLTRLRIWPAGLERPSRGGFMGPFHADNLATACSFCNLAKGYRRVRGYVEACRHIATYRGGTGEDFGLYPTRFRNNVSKRSRSCYISASSTHSKTHSLTNEQFNAIVSQPCRYCGKASDPPRHYNGLDRIDNSVRVYNEETCCACCGDCNVLKYVHSEEAFIAKCVAVARHNVGVDAFPGDVDEAEAGEEEEAEEEAEDRFFSKARAREAQAAAAEAAAAEAAAEAADDATPAPAPLLGGDQSQLEAGNATAKMGYAGLEAADGNDETDEPAAGVAAAGEPSGGVAAAVATAAAGGPSHVVAWDEWEGESERELDQDDERESAEQEPPPPPPPPPPPVASNPFAAFAFEAPPVDNGKRQRRR